MKYAIITAQVVVRVAAGRTNAFATHYVSEALAAKNDVLLIMGVEARELTPEEYAHVRQEAPDA